MDDSHVSRPASAEGAEVENFSVTVERHGNSWEIVTTADGVRTVIESHSDEESARRQAELLERTATRHENAAREEVIPETYPGKGADETDGSSQ
jgi:hypothetical protein